jgi:hypothetical protein
MVPFDARVNGVWVVMNDSSIRRFLARGCIGSRHRPPLDEKDPR